jgi:hypothetical protein
LFISKVSTLYAQIPLIFSFVRNWNIVENGVKPNFKSIFHAKTPCSIHSYGPSELGYKNLTCQRHNKQFLV